ncbi:hypothetical protein [Williamsoniiplasma luminosum]|uniref:Fic family protein n=1 Tax=Williamsoniiplasma luminosum TaxID=214888 RepID=A0A2S0NKI0_9MOLU|nr:hypothetical protein [Williamsoniiplasma luminosum]AVP49519.1 MAG: hypothetical protein C5T88_02995 [Williamsoniiplasma luminosum]
MWVVGLDYFLNDKWVQKTSKNLDNNIYATNLPVTNNAKFHFSFNQQVNSDKFLFDYFKAYEISDDFSIARDDMRLIEFVSLLLIEGTFEETDYWKIIRRIKEIEAGKKPKNRDEFRIWNLIEIMNLINEDGFKINEDNYELVVHILFRNMGFDLDIKSNYYRNNETPIVFANSIKPQIKVIDKEIEAFIKYVENLSDKDISGATQAGIVLNSFLFIYPYQEFSITLAFILSRWYLKRIAPNLQGVQTMYNVGTNWEDFVKKTNQSFEELNLDSFLDFMKQICKNGVNNLYRLSLFQELIEEQKNSPTKIFATLIEQVIVIKIITSKTQSFRLDKIVNNFKIRKVNFVKEEEIKDVIQKMLDLNFLIKKEENQSTLYELNDQFLEKIRLLLKDQ